MLGGFKKIRWVFKPLNVSLRFEIIINIALLMLAAILLIGLSISKIIEKSMVEERVHSAEGMVKDIQMAIDFMTRHRKDASLDSGMKRELQDFFSLYAARRGLEALVAVDSEMTVFARRGSGGLDDSSRRNTLKRIMQSGQIHTEFEKSGSFFLVEYRRLHIYYPILIQGKPAASLWMAIPLWDATDFLARSQRMIIIAMLLNSAVLIIFGSLLLSRILVRPIRDLVRLTRKIDEGDFSQRLEVISRNEIGQLIHSFNQMIDRLEENRENLQNHLKSLELKNKQLKQTQEALMRTEKLASIGRFAAGVAHEVGNPLGAILGYTSILQSEGLDREEAKDYLKRIEKEIERIDRIVKELLNFARPSRAEFKDVDINKVVENTLSLLSYQKNFRNIETQLELQLDLPPVKGDESQLSQVFVNIVLNAIDAMPSGGILRIRTEEMIVDSSFLDSKSGFDPPRRKGDPAESDYYHLRKPNPLSMMLTKFSKGDRIVKARISDTGIGIKKEDMEKIFDPFFTTKAPDKGTGLGLSICLRIIESMGGEMKVESEVGKGSAFEIYLPAA